MSNENVELSELIPQDKVSNMGEKLKLLESIESVDIKTEDQYESAASVQSSIKKAIKELENDRKAIVTPFKDKAKMVDTKYKEVRTKLENGASQIGQALAIFYKEMERKRLLEQRKREAEADEKRRKAEEAARKEREKADEYLNEGREDMAEKAEARAASKLDEAATTVAPEVQKKKVKGLSFRTDYEVVVEDMQSVISGIMDNISLRPILLKDDKIKSQLESSLKKIVKSLNGEFEMKGLKIVKKNIPVSR